MPRASTQPDQTREEREILGYLKRPGYRPLTVREVLREMEIPDERRRLYRRAIRSLIREGRVVRARGNRLAMPGSRHADKRRTGGARTLLGVFRGGRRPRVESFDPAVRDAVPVMAGARHDARDGDAVSAEIVSTGTRAPETRVVEVIGPVDSPGVDAEVVARRYGLARSIPPTVLEAANELEDAVPIGETHRRERFDDPPPVTIDGETARDFDDAIAVERLPRGGFRLFVHIADVSHFVLSGSDLDRAALARGTSVYFPDRVLPMLPERLSNDLCSLRPQEDRLVQSVVIVFDADGHVVKTRFADGVIRSSARLTYTQVAAALEGKKRGHAIRGDVARMLRVADELRQILERRRRYRGSIDFDLPEPQILMDVEGVVTGVVVEPRNLAHRLIEEFMLVANEAVAAYLTENDASCLYRVHQRPDAAKIELLSEFVRGFGLELHGRPERVTSKKIRNLLERAEGRPEYGIIAQVALRAMQQARYATQNVGHFSLAAPVYCHFTSPIRRYPDLVVHRLLRACRGGDVKALRKTSKGLDRVAEACSALERNAEAAERELLEWKKIVFMNDRVGDELDGIVTAVAPFGLFIRLTETLVEGLLRVESLGDEWFEWVETRQELRGARTGTSFRLGDRMRVRVSRVDTVLRRMDLEPAGSGDDRPSRRSRHSGRVDRRRGGRGRRRDGARK